MNSAEVLPLAEMDTAEEQFEIILMVRSKQSDRKVAYSLSQREIDHGHVPRIVQFLKEQIRERINAISQGKEGQDTQGILGECEA